MAGHDYERDEQARVICKALDECPKGLSDVAWGMGVEPEALQKWKLGKNRFPMTRIFAFARSIGSIDFLNRIARRHGYAVVELPAIDDNADLSQQVKHLNIAANRAAAAMGKAVGRIADATDDASPGGEIITRGEGIEIETALSEAIGTLINAVKFVREHTRNDVN